MYGRGGGLYSALKSGDIADVCNYKPIARVCIFSQVFESIVKKPIALSIRHPLAAFYYIVACSALKIFECCLMI